MAKLDDALEKFSIWFCFLVFGGLTVALPSPKPIFFDVTVRPVPLNSSLPPIFEAETLTIHPLSLVSPLRFDDVVRTDHRRLRERDGNKEQTRAENDGTERVNESSEFPREGVSVAPLAPSAPTNVQIAP
jgi:hypothetical protein